MTDIQRWDFIPLDNPVHGVEVFTGPHWGDEGVFVLYADHVADKAEALRQAEQAGYADAMTTSDEVFLSGVEQGQRDALAAPDLRERITKVMIDNAVETEGGPHSWRCFDKERYPGYCTCVEEIVNEVIAAIKGDGDEPV